MLEFFKWLFDFLAGLKAQRDLGVEGKTVTHQIEGTGYDVEAERAERRARLMELCQQAIHSEGWRPHDITGDGAPETFCNRAADYIAKGMGCDELGGLSANQQFERMAASLHFRRDSGERAARHAERGRLAFAAKQYARHGHIAAIYPEPMQRSGSWGKDVPMVANVGKENGVMKTSEAFPVADGEPDYFLFRPEDA